LIVKTWNTGRRKGLNQKMIPVLNILKYQPFVSLNMNTKIHSFGVIFAKIILSEQQ